jgi:hypothetical protein
LPVPVQQLLSFAVLREVCGEMVEGSVTKVSSACEEEFFGLLIPAKIILNFYHPLEMMYRE